ncbi:M48 family metallopeptidase [Enterobacteriaceae bacterium LUAb1]
MSSLLYLQGYAEPVLQQVHRLIAQQALGKLLDTRYPVLHNVTSDSALYTYVNTLKNRWLHNAPPINKVIWDNKINVMKHALGLHSSISRVQGRKLKAKAEIRISTLFKHAPEPFLKMIVVHELAHLREKSHNKAFYQCCCHMEPQYHQLEFDARLWLTHRSLTSG